MTTIYLIRHGQTDWNREEVFRGRADQALNETGRSEARAISQVLSEVKIDFIYASPLIRAVQTAEPTASFHNLDIIKLPDLIDIDFGDWQGLTHDKVKEKYPDLYRLWKEHPEKTEFPGGECLEEVGRRAVESFYEVSKRHEGQVGVLVSHRVVNKVLLLSLLGLDFSHFWEIKQDTGAINIIDIVNKRIAIQLMNDTCHLKGLSGERLALDF